jgi:hypothetical protein
VSAVNTGPIDRVAAFLERDPRRTCALLLALVCLCYLPLYTTQWSPSGGDDAYYLTVARNLAARRGYTWQGVPALWTPPAWPALLALAMGVSPSFAFLNLMLSALLLAALGLWFSILRRLCSSAEAFVMVLIAALLFEVHRFTQAHYAEPLFFALTAGCLLICLQLGEGRRACWRVPLLVVLCAAATLTRFAALMMLPVFVGAVLLGRVALRRRLAVAVIVVAAATAAFVCERRTLNAWGGHTPEAETREAARGTATELTTRGSHHIEGFLARGLGRAARGTTRAGRWVTRLFWPPATMGRAWPPLQPFVNAVGWAALSLLGLAALRTRGRPPSLWLGVLGLCGLLAAWSGRPVPRYLAPASPLLLLGVRQGSAAAASLFPARTRRAAALAAGWALLASVAACNGAILAVNAAVARSPQAHRVALAGEYGELLDIAEELRARGIGDGDLCLHVHYTDPNRRDEDGWAHRLLAFMLDVQILRVPAELSNLPPDEGMVQYARGHGARYILTGAEHRPTRIWHLRLDAPPRTPAHTRYYALWAIQGRTAQPVPVSAAAEPLRRVPGL